MLMISSLTCATSNLISLKCFDSAVLEMVFLLWSSVNEHVLLVRPLAGGHPISSDRVYADAVDDSSPQAGGTSSIDWFSWDKLQENPIFHGKIYGFL